MREYVRHPAGVPIQLHHAGEDYPYMLQNVSLGGAACQGAHAIDVNTSVMVRMHLLRPVYESAGRIVWCRESHDQGYDLGIEFTGERNKDRLRMVEQISHIEHYRNEVRTMEGRNLDGEQAAREWVSIYTSEAP